MSPKIRIFAAVFAVFIIFINLVSPLPAKTTSRDKPKASICSLPALEPGSPACFASFRRWTFNSETKKCEEIYYGGCFGTENLFGSFDECRKVCIVGGRRGASSSNPGGIGGNKSSG